MKGTIFKLFRCPLCKMNKRTKEPLRKPPPCTSCGSSLAYYSDDWYISYNHNKETFIEAVSPFKEFAVKKLTEIRYNLDNGTFTEKVEDLKWEEAYEKFIGYVEVTKKSETARFYKEKARVLDSHFKEKINRISEISPQFVLNYAKERLLRVTNTTVNRELTTIKFMLKKLTDGSIVNEKGKPYLKENPLKTIEAYQENDERDTYWTKDEVQKLLIHACSPNIALCILLASDAGLRLRTIEYLRLNHINMEEGKLELPASTRKRGKYTHYVIMTKRLKVAMKDFLKNHPGGTPFLFFNKTNPNNPWSKFQEHWTKTRKATGILNKRFHDLKHTAGTYYYEATEDIRATADFLDHADINMTRKYARIVESRKVIHMNKFEEIMS